MVTNVEFACGCTFASAPWDYTQLPDGTQVAPTASPPKCPVHSQGPFTVSVFPPPDPNATEVSV